MRLHHPLTRIVRKICEDNDINPEFVRMAIENRFDEYGDDFEDGTEFLNAIYELVDGRSGTLVKQGCEKVPTYVVSSLRECLLFENNGRIQGEFVSK